MKTKILAAGVAAVLSLSTTLALALPQAGVDAAGIDRSVQPGDDFFRYANGAWYARTEIPADRSSWGVTGEMRNRTDEQVSNLIKAQTQAAPATAISAAPVNGGAATPGSTRTMKPASASARPAQRAPVMTPSSR